ncbi:reticulon-4 [Trichechus manatus latirostris]|uniref:Reticulon n=1 Tax=Trichechus manatus latirostris TaxID=127582 RepID=A0A2Y9FXM7_TRIMA|nr:reticulon-4 [Trichechus manatus latirostris]
MEDLDQSPLVSSSADTPPRPQPQFKYQFVREPEDEEEEDEEDEEDEDEDLEELEVLERKPAAGLAAAPVPAAPVSAAPAPLLDLENEPSRVKGLPRVTGGAAGKPGLYCLGFGEHVHPTCSRSSPASLFSPPSGPHSTASLKLDETLFALPAASEPVMHSSAVVDLLYWRDIKKTGVVFGASLFLLLSLTVFSIVSVTAYIALALLSVTISFRIYKGVIQAIQKSDEGHPFRAYLESEVAISEELVQKYSDSALGHVNCTIKELRRLFLVDDLVDSLKFAVLMWVFTYVGALFNGLTLLILALISLFSVPVIYERHQAQIDHYLGLVNKSVKDVVAKIQAKIPGLKRKAE